jgi:hypothetical protein
MTGRPAALAGPEPAAPERRRGLRWRPSAAWATAAAVILVLGVLNLSHISEFIYYRF